MSIQQRSLAETICICTDNHDPDKRIECRYAARAADRVVAAGWGPANADAIHWFDLLRAVQSFDRVNSSDLPLTLLEEIDRALTSVIPPGCAQPDAWSAPTVETSREGQSGGSDARDTRAREVVNNPRISEPTGTVSTPVW